MREITTLEVVSLSNSVEDTTADELDSNIKSCMLGTSAQRYNILCKVDGNPCEVLVNIQDNLTGTPEQIQESIDFCRYLLPCTHCRLAEQQCGSLSGVRLGKLERRALMMAPHFSKSSMILEPINKDRSGYEANRRAIRKLFNLGLLYSGITWEKKEVKARSGNWTERKEVQYKTIWITPLGYAVRQYYLNELKNEKPIRWGDKDKLYAMYRSSTHQLMEMFTEKCKKDIIYYLNTGENVAASKLERIFKSQ